MKIGLFLGDLLAGSPDDFVAGIAAAHADGFASAWVPQVFGWDTLTLLGVAGREGPGIELGTAVVPTYPRHPMALAGQALTVQSLTGGRLALGIGLSHKVVIEGMLGYSFDRPAVHMREYLAALQPLLRGEAADARGETVTAVGGLSVRGVEPPPVLLAALAPAMLRLAGAVADGTITWMVGPRTLGEHITPRITTAAHEADRGTTRIVAGLPVCVTDDVDGVRARANRTFAMYGTLPSYRAMLDREGAEGPGDVAIIGDEATVRLALEDLVAAGATDVVASLFGPPEDKERTRSLLRSLL